MSDFAQAQQDLKSVTVRPSNEDMLELYALFKQGSEGDVSGKAPGMFDLKNRIKYEAWSKLKGLSQTDAQRRYADKVKGLLQAEGR